jgi:sugar phosphate isomerase/epimerase
MLIGAMNNPSRDVFQEMQWMADFHLDFIDLTLEPPAAAVWKIDPKRIRAALEEYGMPAVGHTAYYLPICSPFESLRRTAVDELKKCIETFAEIGITWMNVHPGSYATMHDRSFIFEKNIQSLQELMPIAKSHGMGLMIENLPGSFNTLRQLSQLLDPLPELGLHLDLGHCNLLLDQNSADEILGSYFSRLRHVHLHDNKGGSADLHLPLGTGNLDVLHYLRLLHQLGYDGTITLEVFSEDRRYLGYSRDLLRELWDSCCQQRAGRTFTRDSVLT